MADTMYKIIGKACCQANPNWFWTFDDCKVNKRKVFKIFNKNECDTLSILFDDSWYNFDKDVCTGKVFEMVQTFFEKNSSEKEYS